MEANKRQLFSVLWGFGLAMIFRRVCQNDCEIIQPVNPSSIKNKKFKISGDKCVTYSSEPVECNEPELSP
jgi:hypothetical protein